MRKPTPLRSDLNDLRIRLADGWERLIAVKAKDQEEARLGRLFNIMMVISLAIVMAVSSVVLLMRSMGLMTSSVAWIAVAFPLAFLPISLFCLIRSRGGHIRPMIRFYVWSNFIAVAVAIGLFDGLYSPVWVLYIWTISIAGSLLAPAHALWMAAGVLAYFLALALLAGIGVYAPPLTFAPGREALDIALTLIMLVFTAGLLTYLSMRSLSETLRHLRESEALYRGVFDRAGDIIFTVAEDTRYTSLNPAFSKITGWPAEEWLGKSFVPLVYAEELPLTYQVLEKTLRGQQVEPFELHIAKQSGDYLVGEFTVAPLRRGDDVILVGICRDVTERKRMDEKIHMLNEELERKVRERTRQLLEAQEELIRKEKLAVLGQIAGNVGHELRNPLGVMNNAVYFLKAVLTDADQTVKDYLDIIGSEIAGSERIVSNLLDSVRTKPPQRQTVDGARLVKQVLAKCPLPTSIHGRLDFPEGLSPLWVDPMQIQQVFRNLIANGVEAMPEGGVLEISAVKEGDTLRIRFRDTGIGIAPENLKKLFQPLFTTKSRGIGLGLAVVKNLTEANGGTIEVASVVGRGTTVSLILPAA